MASAGGGLPKKQVKNKIPSTSEDSSSQEDNVYEVEKILAMAKRNGKMMYKVRWLGYSPQFDTWEPYENVASCKDLLDEFMNNIQKKKRRSTSQDKQKNEGEEDTTKRKKSSQSKKETEEKTEAKESKEEEEHEGPKLKDTFWKDLEEGRINVFDGDMYSKVKGRASSKASSSDEQSSKESKSRSKAPLSASKAQERSRRRGKSKDTKGSHRRTRRHVSMPTSSEESELDTETVVAAQTESRDPSDQQDVVSASFVVSEEPQMVVTESIVEVVVVDDEAMEVDLPEEKPEPVVERPASPPPTDKTPKPKSVTTPAKLPKGTTVKVQQKTPEAVDKAVAPSLPAQTAALIVEAKPGSARASQPKPIVTKAVAVASQSKLTTQPKQVAIAAAPQPKPEASTPHSKQSSAQISKPAISTPQAKSATASTPQTKPTSTTPAQSKPAVASTSQQTKPSTPTTSQSKSSNSSTPQPKPAVSAPESKPVPASTPQSKQANVSTPSSKQAAVSTPQPKQAVASTPQTKQTVSATSQPKEAITPIQTRPALLPTPQPSQPRLALLPTPQPEPKQDTASKQEVVAARPAEKEAPTPVPNTVPGSNSVATPVVVVKPQSPAEESPARITFTFKKYNPDDWTRKDSYELTQAVELTNAQFRQSVKRGDYEVLRRALNSNQPFNLEQPDPNNGQTLLMIAAIAGFDDLVELLVMHGANINACQKNGCTALMLASELGHTCTVVVLLGLGAHMDIQQTNGETALMKACRKGHAQVVQLLLEHGANFAAVTNSDTTALKFAKTYDHPSIENILVDHISRLTSAFETQVNITLNNTAKVNHALFPIHCFSLNEGTCFKVFFNHMLTQCQPGVGMLLFIAHARITSQEVKCRFYGQCAVTSVYLNGTKQPSLTEEANFVLSFSPLRNGKNELIINTLQTFTSKVKLFVCAYKAQLAGANRS